MRQLKQGEILGGVGLGRKGCLKMFNKIVFCRVNIFLHPIFSSIQRIPTDAWGDGFLPVIEEGAECCSSVGAPRN